MGDRRCRLWCRSRAETEDWNTIERRRQIVCVPCSRTQHYHAPSPGHPYWDLFEVAFRPLFPFRTTNPGVYSDGGRFVLFASWIKAGAPPLSAFHFPHV